MDSLFFSPTYGDWSAYVNIPYTTSYDRDTNQTTVTFSQASSAYYGRQGYGTRMDCKITVTATDSNNEESTTLSTYGYTAGSSEAQFYGTPSPSSVTVTHSGTGTKQVKVSASCTIHVYMYSSSTSQTGVTGEGSTITTVGSRFMLSINQSVGSTISVERDGILLSSGSLLSGGEQLIISFAVDLGYSLTAHTVNSNDFVSGETHLVAGDVSVVSKASALSYQLTVLQGNNTSVSVNRVESPIGGGAQGYLSNGETIYYGDKLSISYAVAAGYTIGEHTINNTLFNPGTVYSVYQAVTVATTATLNTYPISVSIDAHMGLSVVRIASPLSGASTGEIIPAESAVFHGDVLVITALPSPGYSVEQLTVNETPVSNPYTITVVSPLAIAAIARALGFVYIDSGASIEKYKIVIDSGSAMNQYRAMIDTGSAIVPF